MTPLLLLALLPLDLAAQTPQGCHLPARPVDLVLGVERLVVPIGPPGITHEAVELTAGAACTRGTPCVRVAAAVLERLSAQLRALGPMRHGPPGVSPHYGLRAINARWRGGSCHIVDDVSAPIDRRDVDAFWAAWSAIAGAAPATPAPGGR
jgi:hypothetical protein